jgi:hypothetical protein
MSEFSRRSLVTSAAALPALAVPAVAVAAAIDPADKMIVQIADKMLVGYDRLGTLGRDIEDWDWEPYCSLSEQLWETPASSIDGIIAKARVLDQRLRCAREPHTVLKESYAWQIVDDLLALRAQS